MKNKVIRNFLIFVGFWVAIILVMNVSKNRPIFYNFPWEVVLIFLLSLIPLTTTLTHKVNFGIDFVIFYIYMMITSEYLNFSSMIVFVLYSILMVLITEFISKQFKKGI